MRAGYELFCQRICEPKNRLKYGFSVVATRQVDSRSFRNGVGIIHASLRDAVNVVRHVPGVETPGYRRVSLREKRIWGLPRGGIRW